jgi:hypothetical protein
MVVLGKMPDGTAQSALDGFSEALSAIPPELRKTFTYDQGREMSKHAQLTERTGMAVYFCDPHSPWQRGWFLSPPYSPLPADLAAALAASIAFSFSSLVSSPAGPEFLAGAGAAWDDGWAGGCEDGAGSLPHALKITVVTAADRSKDFMCFPRK